MNIRRGMEQGSGAPAMVPRHANTIHGPYDEQPAPCICAGSALNGQGWMGCYRRCSKAFRIQRRRRRRGGNNESSRITRLLVCSARVNIRFTQARTVPPPVFELVLDALLPRCFPFLTFKWTGCGVADDDTVSRMEWKKYI